MSKTPKRKMLIADIEAIMHPKHPDCIINIPEKVIDEVLAKIDEMDKEMLAKETQANQLYSEVRVLQHKKYEYLDDIFFGHIDSQRMMAGGLLMENHESSEDRRRRNEEARIAREERIDTLVRILQRNKRRIEEKKR
jgi:hypothetical protein